MQFPTHPAAPFDARPLFAPLTAALLEVLSGLSPAQWRQPSGVGAWSVHQLAAHILDGMRRRVAAQRDGWQPPPQAPITDYASLVAHVNTINRAGVEGLAARSPRQLIEAVARASAELIDCFAALPLEAPGFYAVAWAGQQQSPHWFDVARELTEQWHHQQQLRVAVGAPELSQPHLTHAVLRAWMVGLPHAYRAAQAAPGARVHISLDGPGGGSWALRRDGDAWAFDAQPMGEPTAAIAAPVGVVWRLYSRLISPERARAELRITGPAALAEPLLRFMPFLVLR